MPIQIDNLTEHQFVGYCQQLQSQAKRRTAGAIEAAQDCKLLDTLFSALAGSRIR